MNIAACAVIPMKQAAGSAPMVRVILNDSAVRNRLQDVLKANRFFGAILKGRESIH
jgi:hypothetical protein